MGAYWSHMGPDAQINPERAQGPSILEKKNQTKTKIKIMRMIFGGQIDEYDYHYFGWNFQFLHDYLNEANFSKVERVHSFGLFNDTSDHKPYGFPISLNVIATK